MCTIYRVYYFYTFINTRISTNKKLANTRINTLNLKKIYYTHA